jgi:peptide methionine sulfoxide reductase msrA/msrB
MTMLDQKDDKILPLKHSQPLNHSNLKKDSNKMPRLSATHHLESIILGAGCFWGAEKSYEHIPGVIRAISGYAGGTSLHPTYKEVTQLNLRLSPNNHVEVVKVTFNRLLIDLNQILKYFYERHDPTQINRQGNDVGTQYRSVIFVNNTEQMAVAQKITQEYQKQLTKKGFGKIVTIIKAETQFYKAEEYHQNYLVKNPKGYCPNHSTGVLFESSITSKKLKESLLSQTIKNKVLFLGKQILILDSKSDCPYCKQFKQDVLRTYKGKIPITFRFADQLHGLTLKTPTWATPTIVFLIDGVEVFGHQGYMNAITFYKALGAFKLGKSESYAIAFNNGTEAQYCQQYAIFKDTPDGIFVDILSGIPLFDTRDRFNSKSGWLSFTHPIKNAVIELPDNRFGMQRIEIRAKTSGIHLGHVFPDGPKGQKRYCINANVLRFIPRTKK